MEQLIDLLRSGSIKQIVYGLSRSHHNSVRIFSIDKSFTIRPNNISMVYEAALSYYNTGFAKETGTIHQLESIIEDYLNLIKLMFSAEFGHEKAVVSVKDIQQEDALLDYSLFCLYVLLINYKNIRIALWKDFQLGDFAITALYELVYKTSVAEISQLEKGSTSLPFDKWKIVASNIVLNIKNRYGYFDTDGEFPY